MSDRPKLPPRPKALAKAKEEADKPKKVDGKFRRNRPRVKGSWRDKNKGKCFTTKAGQVVCEGSKGFNRKKNQDKTGYLGDRELEKKYAGYSVKQLNAKLDSMSGTNSKGGGTKADKIRKIHKNGGRLRLNPEK